MSDDLPDAAAARRYADALAREGRRDEAGVARLRALALSARDPDLAAAAAALAAGRLQEAHVRLRPRLASDPDDLAVLRMMAEVAARTGHDIQAARLLAHALALAPGFDIARRGLAEALYRAPPADALAEVDRRLALEPGSNGFANLRAALLDRAGRYEESLSVYERLRAADPSDPALWTASGHMLKTLGRRDACVAAHRESIRLDPRRGESWWALADLKTGAVGDDDRATLAALSSDPTLAPHDRALMLFALGTAAERVGEWTAAFDHYARANAIMRGLAPHDPGELPRMLAASRATYTPAFFAARQDWGLADADPIFIVGMPRSGSTLLEQMLASHPAIDGTMELDELPRVARQVDARATRSAAPPLPQAAAALSHETAAALGRAYLAGVAPHRRGGRFVVDKRPENFALIGLIRLILPRATIIDVRRDPRACCLSLFKQHFASGRAYSYALEDLAATYRTYRAFIALWDEVLPGAVIRVEYETLVAEPEAELGRVLAAIGLPFDRACLDFHANPRAVRTPSAEQVRRPLNDDGLAQWRHFEPWLGAMIEALGDGASG